MESILHHLGVPISIAIVVIGISIGRRIGSDDALEADALQRENARLATELRKYRQSEAQSTKDLDAISTKES